jgi:ubiquinone/menaquinone biosynthesis C-methylase UbiE
MATETAVRSIEQNREYHVLGKILAIKRVQAVLHRLNCKGETMLDVGCGEGGLLEDAQFKMKVGLDITDRWFRKMRRKPSPFHFIVGDALHLPFKKESFDVVTVCEVLEHLKNVEGALNEVARVTHQGGSIIVSVPNDILWLIGQLFLLRFRAIKTRLHEHKQRRSLLKKLKEYLGRPIFELGISFSSTKLPYFLCFSYVLEFQKGRNIPNS